MDATLIALCQGKRTVEERRPHRARKPGSSRPNIKHAAARALFTRGENHYNNKDICHVQRSLSLPTHTWVPLQTKPTQIKSAPGKVRRGQSKPHNAGEIVVRRAIKGPAPAGRLGRRPAVALSLSEGPWKFKIKNFPRTHTASQQHA